MKKKSILFPDWQLWISADQYKGKVEPVASVDASSNASQSASTQETSLRGTLHFNEAQDRDSLMICLWSIEKLTIWSF